MAFNSLPEDMAMVLEALLLHVHNVGHHKTSYLLNKVPESNKLGTLKKVGFTTRREIDILSVIALYKTYERFIEDICPPIQRHNMGESFREMLPNNSNENENNASNVDAPEGMNID